MSVSKKCQNVFRFVELTVIKCKYVCVFLYTFAGALVQIQVIRRARSFTATLILILLALIPFQPVWRDRTHVYTGVGTDPLDEM